MNEFVAKFDFEQPKGQSSPYSLPRQKDTIIHIHNIFCILVSKYSVPCAIVEKIKCLCSLFIVIGKTSWQFLAAFLDLNCPPVGNLFLVSDISLVSFSLDHREKLGNAILFVCIMLHRVVALRLISYILFCLPCFSFFTLTMLHIEQYRDSYICFHKAGYFEPGFSNESIAINRSIIQ